MLNLLDVNFDVSKVLDQVQAAIQKYGPTIWEAAVRQAYVDGWTALAWGALLTFLGLVGLIAGVVCWRVASRRDNAWEPLRDDWERTHSRYERPAAYNSSIPGGWAIAYLVIAVFLFLAAGGVTFDGAKHLMNPTWYALQNLRPQ